MRFEEFLAQEAESIRSAAALARLERYAVSLADFARALHVSAERYAPEARGRELKAFLLDLRLEDLALATACALGTEAAWEEFDRTYRKYLENVAGDDEVAGEVIAGLYGTGRAGGQIGQFRGRSSLKGWLRAIVSQAQVDRHRRESRLEPLEELRVEPARQAHPEAFERRENAAALARALKAEVAGIEPGQRLLLSWYYVDQLRLAQIARLRRVHESTISRELEALRRELRKRVEKRLRAEGFSPARMEECFRHSIEAPVDFGEMLEKARNAG
jgi:RNA polymerase sigma factor (sigma-70 family)